MTNRLLSRGDLLALIDRACPVVDAEQHPADPIEPFMLHQDAIMLLGEMALRFTGLPLLQLLQRQHKREHAARMQRPERGLTLRQIPTRGPTTAVKK